MSRPQISEDLDVKMVEIAGTVPGDAPWLAMYRTPLGVQVYMGMIPEEQVPVLVGRFKEALDDLVLRLEKRDG